MYEMVVTCERERERERMRERERERGGEKGREGLYFYSLQKETENKQCDAIIKILKLLGKGRSST